MENYETVKKVETILDFEQAKRELKAAAREDIVELVKKDSITYAVDELQLQQVVEKAPLMAAISSEESDRENQLRVIGNRERRKTSALGRRKTSRLRTMGEVDGGSPGGSTHKLSPKNSPKTSPSTSSCVPCRAQGKKRRQPGRFPSR